MASIMEMSLMCRLCLAKDKNQVNIPIFEDPGDIRQIFVKISSCLPIKISRDDQLPKNICDGCGDKLELLYEFWNTSLDSEKTLTAWLKQVKDPAVSAVTQQISKPAETLVKEETDAAEASTYLEPAQESSINEEAEIEEVEPEEPPKKRARRTAAVKAQINIAPESDDEDDNFDNNMDEPDSVDADVIAKLEGESEESDGDEKDPSFADLPGTSTQDQPGTSGLGKDGAEAPPNFNHYRCDLCYFYIKSLECLCNQVQKLSDPTLAFKCPVCSKGFKRRYYVEVHLNNTHKFKPEPSVNCPECNKGFKRNNLKRHIQAVHGELPFETKQQCDICGKQIKGSLAALTNHKNLVHLKKYTYYCEVCGKGFVNESNLKKHIDQAHNQRTLLSCPENGCGKIYRTKQSLDYHLTAAHATNPQTLTCSECDKIFTHPFLYNRHRRRHKKGPDSYPCDICDKVLSTKASFLDHTRIHSGEKPFACDWCGKEFSSKKQLKVHTVVHTKEKPYGCKLCDKRYTQRGTLSIHMKNLHST